MITGIDGFVLVTPDPERLAAFYTAAFGCTRQGARLLLADAVIEMAQAGAEARAYPAGSTAADLCFQHFAIVTHDIEAAARAAMAAGAVPITQGGPQLLPPEAGGVRAWKFRDPDLHPLELLQFPSHATPARWRQPGPLCLGIDHSAISVADADASIGYYGTRFGFRVVGRQVNHGPAQSRLDGIGGARVDVVALQPPLKATPHLELLAYRPPGQHVPVARGDVAATCLLFATDGDPPAASGPDPDGHWADWRPAPAADAG